MTTTLLSLPPELLLLIADHLSPRPLRSLSQTCSTLRSLLTCIVHAPTPASALLLFAATHNHPLLLRIALHRGATHTTLTPANQHISEKTWAPVKYDNILLDLRIKASLDGTCVDRYTLTTLHRAAAAGHEDIVRLLIAAGADVGARTSRGDTALHVAAEHGHVGVVGVLLERGAAVDAPGWRGCSALHYAAMMGKSDVASALVAAGAGVGARDVKGAAPLHLAAWRGEVEVVRFLVVVGAEVGARDKKGATPLHFAAGEGKEEMVGVLVEAGAERAAVDEGGETPWRWAWKGGHGEVAEKWLKVKGARWRLVDYVFLKAFR
ncbi:ankyrin [Morchella conica CCBAS932]|uniref:Ankyrin n=1 Tax=Morchella conica CCBAS932 TaxID=1392247 RepID=A0A3N4K9V7_9PEZI|nr:ankyrin [Morchella conica CCBAS932]